VLVDIPKDSRAPRSTTSRSRRRLPGYQPTTEGNQKQIRQAAKALAAASARDLRRRRRGQRERLGGAARVRDLSDRFPVTCTLMGLGAFPAPHEQWLGMLGMHGTRGGQLRDGRGDLICAVGARFDDRITGKLSEFAPRRQVHPHRRRPGEISKNVKAHIPIVGDAKHVLDEARDRVPRARRPDPARAGGVVEPDRGLAAQVSAGTRTAATARSSRSSWSRSCTRLTGGDAIITSDVGQHQMWAAQYYDFDKPRRWINSGGLGTMGFGLPAAMGAKLG
jgi:acetolactate synthase-1/2/3 large subunit